MSKLKDTSINNSLNIGGGAVADYIVSQGKNSNGWYRIWASGWKECGNVYWKGSQVKTTVTITFPITFTDTNYTFNHTWLFNSSSGASSVFGEIYTKRTTTSTQIYDAAGWFGYEWRCEGY